MNKFPIVQKYIAFDGNPFFHLRQNSKGEIFARLMDFKQSNLQFHFSRHTTEFHCKYGSEKSKESMVKKNLPKLNLLKSEEEFIEFVLTDTMAKRKYDEKIIHPVTLNINSSKYDEKLMLVTLWFNSKRNIQTNKWFDFVTDYDFIVPISILVQRFFREMHWRKEGIILI